MKGELKPIRSEADYERSLAEVERLWGARSGTPEGDHLDVLATLIDAYEAERYPMDPPDPIEAIKFDIEIEKPGAHSPRLGKRRAFLG
jgi:HTH-type transcriptional regulator / antitoxin HigA